jgi:hypothetical protein
MEAMTRRENSEIFLPLLRACAQSGNLAGQQDTSLDGDDWIQCTSCRSWRFFPHGASTSDDDFTCVSAGRVCQELNAVEQFMVDWTSVCDTDDQSLVYRFYIDGKEFSVHELFWSVSSFGGLAKVAKLKDVAGDMLNRKYKIGVNSAPGKNFGMIRHQWDKWALSKYAEKFCHRCEHGHLLSFVYFIS